MCAPENAGETSPAKPAALGTVPILEERNDPLSLAAACALSIRLTCSICGRDTEPELEAEHRGDGGLAFVVLNVASACWFCKSRAADPASRA